MMSLLTFFAQNVLPVFNVKTYFTFPLPQIYDPYKRNFSIIDQNRVLRFLLKEGFFDVIDTLQIETNICEEKKRLINELGDVLNYFDCHLYETNLINCNSDDIEEIIDNIISKIEINLQKRKLSSFIINNINYKTRVFLTETIDNVKKHAYSEDNLLKYAMVYVRYRYGSRSSMINSIQQKRLDKLVLHERNHYPRFVFSPDSYYEQEGFLEIFITDVGKGIAESSGFRAREDKWPAHKAFYSVISDDRDKPEKTLIGGLKHIGKILINDQILSKDREEWLGCRLSLLKTSTYHEAILPKSINKFHIQGCYWLARISCDNKTYKIDEDIWQKINNENTDRFQKIYENELVNSRELLKNYGFIDERFNPFISNWSLRNNAYSKILSAKKAKTIYYSPLSTQKHLIEKHIITTFINNLQSKTELYIVDINENETETYISALHKAHLVVNEINNMFLLHNIYLITKQLYCCVLSFDDEKKQYIIDKGKTNAFINSTFENSLSEILKAIITFDSLSIWQEVASLKKLHTFINSNILWDKGKNKYISGYLDFNQLCTVPKFTQLFEIAILRYIGISSIINKTQVDYIDPLVKNIVNSFNSRIPHQIQESEKKIWVGSVLVAGYVQNEITSINNLGVIVHCFLHPDSDKKHAPRLFIWPKKEWIKNFHTPAEDFYQRLGRTHAIAPYGWKFYKIPRYDKKEISLYFRSPQHSYKDWQSEKVGLRIGNYEYDGYYELFKLDIKYVIDAAFAYYTDLAVYLFANFFIALGGKKREEIKDPIMQTKSWDVISNILNDEELMKFYNDVVLIAYPNHYYTNIIIDKISYLLDKDFFDKRELDINSNFIDRIVPLNFIRHSNSNSSGLISPLTFDEIGQLISSKEGERNIILFDDAIVNGRTRKEIKHLLFNQFEGVTEVRTLSIIDRFRLPYDIPNPSKHKSYWRLDVPRLGNKKNNPITNAINKAKDEARNFTPTAQKIVDRWEVGWKKRNPFQDDPAHGLLAETISLINPYKKFGLKYNDLEKDFVQIGTNEKNASDRTNQIKIENSIGAAIYAIEIYCLTGRDDIAYNFAIMDNNEISDKAKIQILCSFLLFFDSEIRFSIKKLMLDKLVEILNAQNSMGDNETALACLTLINQNKDTVKAIFETASKEHKMFNEDLSVAFAIALPYDFIQKNEIKFLKRIFLDSSFSKDWNDRKTLHLELYEQGSAHINTFRAFIENRDNSCSPNDLIFCLEQFHNICTHLNFHLYANLESTKENLLKEMNNCIELLRKWKKENHEAEIQQVRDELVKLNNLLLSIHSNIFYQLSDVKAQKPIMPNDFFIVDIINKLDCDYWKKVAKEKGILTDESNNVPCIYHTNNLTELIRTLNTRTESLWVPCERSIKLHIRNIISNVMHGTYDLIESPFTNSIKEKAHLWYDVELDLENHRLIIIFANQMRSNGEDYIRKATNSIREEKYYSEKLECKTNYYCDPQNTDILFCKVTLPILK